MKKKHKRGLLATILVAVLAVLSCNYSLDSEDWPVFSDRLPEAFDGFRIALLTDLHGAQYGTNSETLLQAVRRSAPDLIAISGDLVDEDSSLAVLEPLLTGLCRIAPTYFVTGNHEWVRDDTEDVLTRITDCGVTVLRNDYLTLEQNGQTLVLAGADDQNASGNTETPEQLVARIRRQVPGDPYIAMLFHRNNMLDLWAGLDVDLVLAGHGHGGVIRLPLVGGLLGVDRRFFPKDSEGLYTQGRTTLAVSRGLGGVRLWNPPHLPTIVLRTQRS